MYFKNEWHEKLFESLVDKVGEWARSDRVYCAALYALAAVEKENIVKYANVEGIEFDRLLDVSAPWSSGEKAMLILAGTLFNNYIIGVSLHDLFYPLDKVNVDAALEALKIRYR